MGRHTGGGPSVRLVFRGERATPAVLAFLRETKVGREEEEGEDVEAIELFPEERMDERRVDLTRPENVLFLGFCIYFLCPFFVFSFVSSFAGVKNQHDRNERSDTHTHDDKESSSSG